jgi:hypothetical protein
LLLFGFGFVEGVSERRQHHACDRIVYRLHRQTKVLGPGPIGQFGVHKTLNPEERHT